MSLLRVIEYSNIRTKVELLDHDEKRWTDWGWYERYKHTYKLIIAYHKKYNEIHPSLNRLMNIVPGAR